MQRIPNVARALLVIAVVLVAGTALYITLGKEERMPARTLDASLPKEALTEIAGNLEIPWDIAFIDDGLLVSERTGNVELIRADGSRKEIPIEGVHDRGEGGLLGLTLHPDFKRTGYVYLYMSSPAQDGTTNRIVRYRYEDEALTEDRVILEGIPGAIYHDGGRMEFGPDGYLYVTTGDATEPSIAQDLSSLGGKILRMTDDGAPAPGNPYDSLIYSYGHRNPQGLAWDAAGRLWSTEHGRSGVQSGLDEINLIEAGANYGWPTIEGDAEEEGMRTPARHSGTRDTWAPASLVYHKGSLYFGGLRGEALYEAVLDGTRVTEVKEHFAETYGRIRTVRLSPDGYLYITTSNRDGRGNADDADDRIIRVDPASL
ncbi:MAG TPA: PQQ-dependent sugar dehydrogenase [Candidatus Paceibacterota bacterium]|nr:PQQ-dependent sugar dehydrogenase [Candidatus Paceibacterota bacterium]